MYTLGATCRRAIGLGATTRACPPIIGVADDGWIVTTRERLASGEPSEPWGGTHGFDPSYRSMHGLFIATGPRFGSGLRVPRSRTSTSTR